MEFHSQDRQPTRKLRSADSSKSRHDYVLLDFGQGERLEQWGPYRLRRPDATAVGAAAQKPELWETADAMYEGEKGKGQWVKKNDMPDHWPVSFDDLHLSVRLAPYKHTGVFPEQQQNWDWMRAESKASGRPLRILNLFAYTGGASVALAKDGHFVTHTDSSKPAIGWAQENAVLNAISSEKIRWMLEDATSFVKKEIKRGKTYDAILLDPPAYGHGTGGKTWRVERDLAPLLEQCVLLLSDKPCFMALNGYSHNDSSESFHKLLTGILHQKSPQKTFSVTAKKLFLTTEDGLRLETGIVARVKF